MRVGNKRMPSDEELLQITGDGDAQEVRAAYSRMVRMAHPDHGGDPETASETIKALQEARDRLLAKQPKVRTGDDTCGTCKGRGFVVGSGFAPRECRACGGGGHRPRGLRVRRKT